MRRLTTLLLLFFALTFAQVATADDGPPLPMPTTPLPAPSPEPAPVPATFSPPVVLKKRKRRMPPGVRAARFARHLIGVRYTYGGNSPRTGFDCSGFVSFVWAHFGVRLPRVSYEQFSTGHQIARRGLRPGDLVFFHGAGHVGLYIGNGRFIHAPHSGTVVSIDSLNGSYGRTYDGARRVD